jgi:hypothetical protein
MPLRGQCTTLFRAGPEVQMGMSDQRRSTRKYILYCNGDDRSNAG